MVTRKNHHLRGGQLHRCATQNLANLQGQQLQAPERALGLSFLIQLVLQSLGQRGVGDISQQGQKGRVCNHGLKAFSCTDTCAWAARLNQTSQKSRLEVSTNVVGQAIKHRIKRGQGLVATWVEQGLQRSRIFKQAV